MATNKKSNTSKTARVMNLLSKNREEVVESESPAIPDEEVTTAPAAQAAEPVSAPQAAPLSAPAPVHHNATPPIISSMQADSAISNQVLSALEDALDQELGTTAAAPAAEPVPVAEPVIEVVEEPAPVEETAAQAEEQVNTAIAEAIAQVADAEVAVVEASEAAANPAAVIAAAEETVPATPPTIFPIDPVTTYVNVMEALVEEKAMKYITLFGLCQCPRCIADVKALALNRLDPKYVVMENGEVIPRISIYEGKFATAVTAQLLTACKMVMEHPRHKLKD